MPAVQYDLNFGANAFWHLEAIAPIKNVNANKFIKFQISNEFVPERYTCHIYQNYNIK